MLCLSSSQTWAYIILGFVLALTINSAAGAAVRDCHYAAVRKRHAVRQPAALITSLSPRVDTASSGQPAALITSLSPRVDTASSGQPAVQITTLSPRADSASSGQPVPPTSPPPSPPPPSSPPLPPPNTTRAPPGSDPSSFSAGGGDSGSKSESDTDPHSTWPSRDHRHHRGDSWDWTDGSDWPVDLPSGSNWDDWPDDSLWPAGSDNPPPQPHQVAPSSAGRPVKTSPTVPPPTPAAGPHSSFPFKAPGGTPAPAVESPPFLKPAISSHSTLSQLAVSSFIKPQSPHTTAPTPGPTSRPDDVSSQLYSAAAYLSSTGNDADTPPDAPKVMANSLQGSSVLKPQQNSSPGRGSVISSNSGGSDDDGLSVDSPAAAADNQAKATKAITGVLVTACISVVAVGGVLYRRKVNRVKAMALPFDKKKALIIDSKPILGDRPDSPHSPLDDIFVAPGLFPTPPRTAGGDADDMGPPPLAPIKDSLQQPIQSPAVAATQKSTGSGNHSYFAGLRLNTYFPAAVFMLPGIWPNSKRRKPSIPSILYSNPVPLASLTLPPAPRDEGDKDIDGAADFVMPINKTASVAFSDGGGGKAASPAPPPEYDSGTLRSESSSTSVRSDVDSDTSSLSRHLEPREDVDAGQAHPLLPPLSVPVSPTISSQHQRHRSWCAPPLTPDTIDRRVSAQSVGSQSTASSEVSDVSAPDTLNADSLSRYLK
ncbi:hypothetical protein HDU87_004683 [Geranomyces variabilis]|uniref:Uncharacterized protein n=1 Tax=Geranomyces variabilis TaxID=109894 RepID=A0AAD5TI87_9FUNG|nr:hypothetical protein HDU87_004683 [Geranomyces variabilis]